VLSRPTLLAGALLAAALGVFLWRQVLSSRGTARDVPIAEVPAIDQTDIDPAVLRLISGARTAVAEAPRSAEAWGRFGKVLLAHGFSDEAGACFAQAEALDPGEPRWSYHQGTILSQGEPDAAIPKLQRAVEGVRQRRCAAAALGRNPSRAGPPRRCGRPVAAPSPP